MNNSEGCYEGYKLPFMGKYYGLHAVQGTSLKLNTCQQLVNCIHEYRSNSELSNLALLFEEVILLIPNVQ